MYSQERPGYRHGELPDSEFRPVDTALLVVDVQYGDAHPDFGALKQLRDRGDFESADYYAVRLRDVVIPNIQRLLSVCRESRVEVIHTGIQSLTQDGRDRSPVHKRLNMHHPPGSKDSQFLPEVAPVDDEIVLYKTCSGVFHGTNIDYVLRNLGITNLIVTGVTTSGCVEVTVRDAADRGFIVTLVEDACATWSAERETNAIRAMRDGYATIMSTQQAASRLIASRPNCSSVRETS